jgi:alpha-L-rhamnosidase
MAVRRRLAQGLLLVCILSSSSLSHAEAKTVSGGLTDLRCDSLVQPLGLDTPAPMLSWRIVDDAPGAKQTAYRLTVFVDRLNAVKQGTPLWDSGKIVSGVSNGAAYQGPPLLPEKRYFWRVQVWDKDNKPYSTSDLSWWETGLMKSSNWEGKWIGYENAELHSIRESGAIWITNTATTDTMPGDTRHDFRLRFPLSKSIARAVLYATGEDTAAAWINGKQVLKSQPLPAWEQMPWGTYVRRDVTPEMRAGTNFVAIGVTRYHITAEKMVPTSTPMSMCLYIVFTDGTTKLVTSASPGWKAILNAPEGWERENFGDETWNAAIQYVATPDRIGARDDQGIPWPTGAAAMLRRSFRQDKAVVSARLYATALGAYVFHINGNKVGDQILSPGWMDFREHVPYQVYDVTSQIRRGNNTIAALLAPGWYSTPLRWFGQGNNYGPTQPALRAQLRLEHADGSVDWIATDASWMAETSPIVQAEIYNGEALDARKEQKGWDTPEFTAVGWKPATQVFPKEPQVVAQYFEPIRIERTMSAKSITSPSSGIYIFDFGQNMAAIPELRVQGRRNDDIKLRFGEALNPDGTLYTENLRNAKATDHLILADDAVKIYEPQFTYHGFRYAEITGFRGTPTVETLKAEVLHTDARLTARLNTGDAMVNQLWNSVLWGQRSNFVGNPSDCPQRDERLGWTADAQVFWRTATYNMDLSSFSRKFSGDLRGTQSGTAMYGIFAPGVVTENPYYAAGWSDAGVIIPWTSWIQTGDSRIIEENWDGMNRYIAEIERKNPDGLWQNGFGLAFGDWLTPTTTTPEDLLATAYWAYDVELMQQMAKATGRTEEAQRFATLHTKIVDAFQKAYVRPDGFVGAVDKYPSFPPPSIHPEDGAQDPDRVVETQTGYVLALHMNLLPTQLRHKAAARLVQMIQQNHGALGTGFLGTPYLLEVLSDEGYSDLAYSLLLNRSYPSWGYLMDHGATTTWERWNGDQMRGDPSMNSYNHYAYGAVAEWLYRYAAGVDTTPEHPGFSEVYLHPNFDARLGKLSLDYDSKYGTIHSDWNVSGDAVLWRVVVPANATARLSLKSINVTNLLLDGIPIERSTKARVSGNDEFDLPSGAYSFSADLSLKTLSGTDHK